MPPSARPWPRSFRHYLPDGDQGCDALTATAEALITGLLDTTTRGTTMSKKNDDRSAPVIDSESKDQFGRHWVMADWDRYVATHGKEPARFDGVHPEPRAPRRVGATPRPAPTGTTRIERVAGVTADDLIEMLAGRK